MSDKTVSDDVELERSIRAWKGSRLGTWLCELRSARAKIIHCEACGGSWYDDGFTASCPSCALSAARARLAGVRGTLQELRIRYHAAGRRPEECYEMSIIDDALAAETGDGD